jgi:CubicO group peptidase (beta-lactamase class C family)
MGIRKHITTLLLILLGIQSLQSQEWRVIDSLIEQQVKAGQISGGVAYVYLRNQIVLQKAYGLSDIERQQPMQVSSIFRIASNTKIIVSIAVLQMAESGLIGLDEPIEKYLPEFLNQKVVKAVGDSFMLVERNRSVTIRDLLTHQSGIASADEFPARRALFIRYGLNQNLSTSFPSLKEEVTQIAKMPLMHQPGERFSYGLSTNVLGRLIELVSGTSLDVYLQKNIFKPLGMKDTYFYLPPRKAARLAKVYVKNSAGQLEAFSSSAVNIDYPLVKGSRYFSAIGGLVSTVADLGKFLVCLLEEGEVAGRRIIGKEMLEQFWSNQLGNKTFIFGGVPSLNNFGLGVGLTTKAGQKINGASEGTFFWGGAFNTAYMVDRKRRLITIFFFQRTPFVLPGVLSQLEKVTIQLVEGSKNKQ